MTRWIWVSLPYATFAVVVRDGVVVDAAPIARWAIGKPEEKVATFYRRKGATFVPLDDAAPHSASLPRSSRADGSSDSSAVPT